MRKLILAIAVFALTIASLGAQPGKTKVQPKAQAYDVAAYLYPAYAADDPRLRPFWPMGFQQPCLAAVYTLNRKCMISPSCTT